MLATEALVVLVKEDSQTNIWPNCPSSRYEFAGAVTDRTNRVGSKRGYWQGPKRTVVASTTRSNTARYRCMSSGSG